MPEAGIFLKEPLFRLAWERAQRGGVPFQALGVQGDLMVVRRGYWIPPWYGEYQWLAGGPGQREQVWKILQENGQAPDLPRIEKFDLQYRGSPEFPGPRGILVIAEAGRIRLELRLKSGDDRSSLPALPDKAGSFSEASAILDRQQAAWEKTFGRE